MTKDYDTFDIVIVGGSYAGLSAALALGRSLRKVLVIDSGLPCNRQTPHSHNFLTQDGQPPAAIATLARTQVQQYQTVRLQQGLATKATQVKNGFTVHTQEGGVFKARKLIIATGISDKLPDIDGFRECWGISVIHCPYCHGYEVRNENTGIMTNAEAAIHYAQLISNLTGQLTILTNGPVDFSAGQLEQFKQKQIGIIEKEIAKLSHESGQLNQVIFTDGTTLPLHALYFRPPFTQHSSIPEDLGCALTEQGYIEVNAFQQTSVAGVFACGDNTSPMRAVATAVATGNLAGAMVNRELCEENFGLLT